MGTSTDWVCDFQGEGTAGPAGAEELGTCEDGNEGPLRSVARSGQRRRRVGARGARGPGQSSGSHSRALSKAGGDVINVFQWPQGWCVSDRSRRGRDGSRGPGRGGRGYDNPDER